VILLNFHITPHGSPRPICVAPVLDRGDEGAHGVAAVGDLIEHPNGTVVVHLDVLTGVLDNYLALARSVAPAASARS
jgi:hypothetical protein